MVLLMGLRYRLICTNTTIYITANAVLNFCSLFVIITYIWINGVRN